MAEESDFLFIYPLFILATEYNKVPETGEVILDSRLRFIAPEENGRRRIAIFTDEHLADEFRELIAPDRGLARLQIASPLALKRFLTLCLGEYTQAAVDPNPKTRTCRIVEIQELLAGVERNLGPQGNPGDQTEQ